MRAVSFPAPMEIIHANRFSFPVQIIAAGERCLVGIKYFGPEVNIEYDREWLEPDGDEILIMQQHCGGENLLVYKGSAKPDGKRMESIVRFN